MKDFFWLSDT